MLKGSFDQEQRGKPRKGATETQARLGEGFGQAPGSTKIQQREADKDGRADCRIETQPQRGDRRRDGCSGEITPRPGADR